MNNTMNEISISPPLSSTAGTCLTPTVLAGTSPALAAIQQATAGITQEHIEQQFKAASRSLADFAASPLKAEETLLGDRLLVRGGVLLVVGPSGIGKSSMGVQQDLLWCLGREAFGIKPATPLRILTVQAENDDGDITEMARGVCNGLELKDTEKDTVGANTRYARSFRTGPAFLKELRDWCSVYRPDIIRIDPLNAYIGGDPGNPRDIASFCRQGLNQLAFDYRCGIVITHHTPKLNFRGDTSKWTPYDWAYAGSGCAELTNWARGVIVIDPIAAEPGTFRFIAAKRGVRIGWKTAEGGPLLERYFKHCRQPGSIFWHPASEEETATLVTARTANQKTADDLLEIMPQLGKVLPKEKIIDQAGEVGIGDNKARRFIKELLDSGAIEEVKVSQSGARPAVYLRRTLPVSDAHQQQSLGL